VGASASPLKATSGPGADAGADKHHLGVELADCKAKLRRLRQELEEKNETIAELKEDLQEKTSLYGKGVICTIRGMMLDN
jgi:predicted RNase H-like nuclease (RuvC/YqgF family)